MGVGFNQAAADSLDAHRSRQIVSGVVRPEGGGIESPIPELLRRAGYSTACIGASPGGEGASGDAGFDVVHAADPSGTEFSDEERSAASIDTQATQWVGNQAVRFIKSAPAPFFLCVHFNGPGSVHNALDPSEARQDSSRLKWPASMPVPTEGVNDNAKQQLARYAESIHVIDSQIGRLLAMLSAHSHTNNVFVYTSVPPRLSDRSQTTPENIVTIESSHRVPFVLSGIGGQRRAERSNAYVQHKDIAPTLLALADVSIPASFNGISLLPYLSGKTSSVRNAAHCRLDANRLLLRTSAHAIVFDQTDCVQALYAVGEHGLLEPTNVVGSSAHIRAQMTLTRELSRIREGTSPSK